VLEKLSVGANGQGFLVRTPSAVAGARGTSFFMKVESATSTYVCACNGAMQVLGSDGLLARELVSCLFDSWTFPKTAIHWHAMNYAARILKGTCGTRY
jgi:hypothetical protein